MENRRVLTRHTKNVFIMEAKNGGDLGLLAPSSGRGSHSAINYCQMVIVGSNGIHM